MTDALQELRDSITGSLLEVLESLDAQIGKYRRTEDPDFILLDSMVADAIMFIASLPELVTIPSVVIAEDGEIFFEWNITQRRRCIVGLEGDGYYGYTLKGNDGHYRSGLYEGRIMEDLPEDLYLFLEGTQ